jgi:uncharacterized SAM-binding protein YcdF (DUF218 family)
VGDRTLLVLPAATEAASAESRALEMLAALFSILKTVAVPGSLTFLGLCLAAGLVATYRSRYRRLGQAFLVLVAAAYFVLALPIVANAIADHLPGVPSTGLRSGEKLDTLVVFDGDNRRGRVREALRVYRTSSPRIVCVLGEDWIPDALQKEGIPSSRLARYSTTPTTRDQVAWVEQLAARSNAGGIAVIGSRLQTPRIGRLLAAMRVPVVLIASPIDDEPPRAGWQLFLPRYIALRVSRDAVYEHVALAYYAWRGWV